MLVDPVPHWAVDLLFDMERLVNEVVVRYGLHERIEVGGRVAVRTDWGGFLDPVIQGLHDLFDFPNGNRAKVEQGLFALRLEARDVLRVDGARPTADPEDLRSSLRERIEAAGADPRPA